MLDGDGVRAALIDAAAAGDQRRLAELCTAHRETIRRDYAAWTKVPAELRSDQAAVQRYAGGIVQVAQFFATRLGDPALVQALQGPPESNPVARWQQALQQAQVLMGEARFDEARPVLAAAAEEMRELQGSAVDSLLPVTYGKLGECLFQLGDAAGAIEPTTRALELCEEQRDRKGVVAYLDNLFEMHRYLGQPEPAAAAAERCADTLRAYGQAEQASWRRRRARVVRAGEPLNRVLVVAGGSRYELDEVPRGTSGGGFAFERNRITLEPARRRTADGERLGGQGRHAEAYEKFREAARLDPFDPHPRYLTGLALLNLRRYDEAVAEYEATERLAPGWFHCRADLWLARELARGALDPELYAVLYQLEDGPQPPAEKVRMAEAALRAAPGLAPLHLFHGQALSASGKAAAAETAYRNGLACAGEPDVRTRLLVALATLAKSKNERKTLLTEAAATPGGNLVAAATATISLRG